MCLDHITPTTSELLKLTLKAVQSERRLPESIGVDSLPSVLPMREAFAPFGVFVLHYAPPSQEEEDAMGFDVAL